MTDAGSETVGTDRGACVKSLRERSADGEAVWGFFCQHCALRLPLVISSLDTQLDRVTNKTHVITHQDSCQLL